MDQDPTQPRLNWPLLLGFWAIVSALLVARTLLMADKVPLIGDTDDAMRLVVVRDFLAGQGWYDHFQYRLNTPIGAELHWSRLVDLPIAGLIALFRPFVGQGAEALAAYVWPLLLFLALLYVSARLTLRLVGPEGILPALAVPVLAPAVIGEFSPGRLDHHGVQIILALVLVWCAVEAVRRPGWAIGAGVSAATAIAVGAEAVPAIAAAVLAFGLMWVSDARHARAMRLFGVSFAVATAAHLALAWPPERWLDPACDAISLVYVMLAGGTGLALLALSLVNLRRLPLRLVLGMAAGAVVAGGFLVLVPDCIAGPNAGLDPWLIANWSSAIIESKPVWRSILDKPELTLAIAVPPLLGLAAVIWRVRTSPLDRSEWLVYGLTLAVTVVVMAVLVRGGRLADAAVAPAAAAAIAAARARYLSRRGLADVAILIGSWLAFAGIVIMLAAALVAIALEGPAGTGKARAEAAVSRDACLQPAAFADLAALPPERIMTPVDLGAHVLAFTPHHVVAGPYVRANPRDQQGVRDVFAFFLEPLDEARRILDERGIGLVVICPAMSEIAAPGAGAEGSFVKLYAAGELPAWLADQSLPGAPLKVFAVLPSGL